MARPITFLSDYGYEDEFAGVCRAVIAGIAPGAVLIDLTHGIPRHAIGHGAAVLARALPFAPPGIHLAVVDPGVGTDRRGVAVGCAEAGRVLVGPDNGLLAPAIERFGGPVEAVDLTLSRVRLEPLSATFHGRDLFAPVAAHLASGAPLAEVGEPIEEDGLAGSPLPGPRVVPSGVLAHVLLIDRFGNAALDVEHERLPETGLRIGRAIEVAVEGHAREASYAQTFGDVAEGELILYEDSYRGLALAVNRGSAAAELGLAVGTEITLRPV